MQLCKSKLRGVTFLCAILAAVATATVAHAATVQIVNKNAASVGFNDPTPATPVGGNNGATVGAQRLIAFQAAADIWASRLASQVTIQVAAQFTPLSCATSSGTLGSAGPVTFYRDFAGAPVASTWYAVALANALHGSDLDPTSEDISANFNSMIGTTGCLQASGWYYGLDSNPASNQFDLMSVVIHELGHGLGFLTLVDLTTGAKALNFDDAYMRNLEFHGATPADYPSMSNSQRVAASVSVSNLHWIGANARAASSVLTAGSVGDHVRMYAPSSASAGSSVSHWDTALTPNQIMEPIYTSALHTPILERPLFRDIGWSLATRLDFNGDGKSDILWRDTNGGVALWLMNGASVLQYASVGGASLSWSIAGTGDFNGDGKSDILWRDTSGGLAVWFMNGASVSQYASLGGASLAWSIAGTGDFNGDGKRDILWRDTNGGVAVWLMNGANVLQYSGVGGASLAWSIAKTGDFNGDGKSDILWRDTSGGLAVWLMNGASVAQYANIGGAALSWSIAGAGDFNGDGKSDILWRDTSGGVAIWLMNGASVLQYANTGGAALAWTIVGTGDFNGDGKHDILWRDTSGNDAIWMMNGANVSQYAGAGSASTVWAIQALNAD